MPTGITSNTTNRLIFDAGAVYKNYSETDQTLLGATRGGATFTVEREDRQIEMDGAGIGHIRGLKRTITHNCRLEVTFVETAYETLAMALRSGGTFSSDGTHHTHTPDNDILAGDYATNVALVADISTGTDPIILQINLALIDGDWSIGTTDQNEGEISVTFVGHYDETALDVPPYVISTPVAMS